MGSSRGGAQVFKPQVASRNGAKARKKTNTMLRKPCEALTTRGNTLHVSIQSASEYGSHLWKSQEITLRCGSCCDAGTSDLAML